MSSCCTPASPSLSLTTFFHTTRVFLIDQTLNFIVQDDQPITKFLSITNGEYKFGMEVLDVMISDAIKKKAGYTYYMAKKVESEKAKIIDDPEEKHTYGKDQKLADLSVNQKKQPVTGEGSSIAHNKYYSLSDTARDATLYSSSSDKSEESAKETDDVDKSDMDLSDDNPHGDDDVPRYGVFTHNKSTATPNSTYLSLTFTSSSLDFIQTLLDETPANELMDFMSHPVYTDAQTTSVVHNLEGNPELISYISGASEVPLDTNVDVLAIKTLMREMFPNKNTYHIPSLPRKKIPYPTTTQQPNSLQDKAKKLMQKAKKNIKKINFKKAVAPKFREYN
nr:hypothetical protein [Tanacetum cinerariifolium]